MAGRRERKGFQAVGEPDLIAGLDLPARRARDLRLQSAWLDVAGEALASRVRAVRVRRGVLDLAIDDPAWARQVADLLPSIAARLACTAPSLGVSRFRLVVGGEGPGPARPLPQGPAGDGDRR